MTMSAEDLGLLQQQQMHQMQKVGRAEAVLADVGPVRTRLPPAAAAAVSRALASELVGASLTLEPDEA